MAADTRAWLEDVDARVAVGKADHLPHIDAHFLGDHAEFVGESDVDVAVAVLDQLDHFGGTGGGRKACPAHEAAVKAHRLARAARRDAADDAVILDQLDEDATGQHALGAIGDVEIGRASAMAGDFQVRARSGEQSRDLIGGADRRSRFEDDEIAALQHRRDGACGVEHIGNVGRIALTDRRWHGDDEGVGGFGRHAGAQAAAIDHTLHQPVQIDFLDMDAAFVDRVNDLSVDVEAENMRARARDHRCGREADIAEADDDDLLFIVHGHRRLSLRSFVRPVHRHRDYGRGPWRHRRCYRRAE